MLCFDRVTRCCVCFLSWHQGCLFGMGAVWPWKDCRVMVPQLWSAPSSAAAWLPPSIRLKPCAAAGGQCESRLLWVSACGWQSCPAGVGRCHLPWRDVLLSQKQEHNYIWKHFIFSLSFIILPVHVTVTHALFLLPRAGSCRNNTILCLLHGLSIWGLLVAVRFGSRKGFFSTKHYFAMRGWIDAFFSPLRNVVLVNCRCSKCRGSGPSCLKQKRPPNEKGAVNTMERSIKSGSSHWCQALSRCSVQMIPQNTCAISSTCCRPPNVALQDLAVNLRLCVEKTKLSKTAAYFRGKWETEGKERSKQLLIVTPYVLRALIVTFPNAKPWHCANN